MFFSDRQVVSGQFRKKATPWFLFSAISLVAYAGMLYLDWRTGTLRGAQTPSTIAWWLLAFGGYLGALWWSQRTGRFSMMWVWVPAILFRLILLFTTPTLSDDVYRYLWDGYIANNGVSPYLFPIAASELDHLAIPLRDLANHTWMASPYLPAAQALFAPITRLLPLQPTSMQIVIIALDLLNGLLIVRLLRLAVLPQRYLLIYLWNPLVVVEAAHGAHIDVWMISLTLLAVWLALSDRQLIAGGRRFSLRQSLLSPIVLALATLTKLLPVLLLPIFVARSGWRYLLAYAVALVVLLLPFGLSNGWGLSGPLDGIGVFGGTHHYSGQWQFNSGLFHWLDVGFQKIGLVPADRWAKYLLAGALLAVLFWTWYNARRTYSVRSLLRLMVVPFMAYVLFTPTLHPWYLLILLAFLPFLAPSEAGTPSEAEPARRWLLLAPWLYLSAAVILSYLTYLNPLDFRELEWVRLVEWLPMLGLLLVAGAWLISTRAKVFR